jgi:hypothetical protein
MLLRVHSCECDRSYNGERGRPLTMWLYEHRIYCKRSLLKNQDRPNMPTRRVIESAGMKPGFWKLNATTGIGNARNRPIWSAYLTWSAIPVSAMKWPTLKANQDIIESPFVYMFKPLHSVHTAQMLLAVRTVLVSSFSSQFIYIDVRDLICWLNCAKNRHFPLY